MRDDAVLFVDDEENIQRSFRREFRGAGWEVLTASTGEEGLKIQEQEEVGIIVSDHRMPGMTGVEFLTIVRERWPDTFRIMLTGYGDLETITTAINAGEIHRFLAKPWDPDILRTAIDQGIERASLLRENEFLSQAVEEQNAKLLSLTEDLEKRVDERTAKLEQAYGELIRKERFAAVAGLIDSLSAEAMNPLTVIAGRADLLSTKPGMTPEYQRMLEEIREESERALALLVSLRDLSRQESPERKRVDVQQLVGQVVDVVAPDMRRREIAFSSALEDAPAVEAYADQLRQVLLCLLSNAADATPTGGEVTIRTEAAGSDASISVRDTGVGIPESERDKILNPLYTTKEEGTGMGLSIALGIVENHGGTLTFDSRVGEGTTFTVTLPGVA